MDQHYKSYEQAALDILRGKKPEEKVAEQKQQEQPQEKQPLSESSAEDQLDEAMKPELEKNFPASGVTKHAAPKTPASTMPKDKEKRGPMTAGSMKKEEVDVDEAVMHPMALHVKRVPGQMKNGQEVYKVHAVGPKVTGIKTGEHLNDTELDDATEAGHKIKMMKEEAEQIEELKSSTMMSYKDKANKEIKALDTEVKTGEYKDIAGKIMDRRMKGVDRASNKLDDRRRSNAKLAQRGTFPYSEEVEPIEELSKSTLASYAKKATRDSRLKMATGKDFERVASRSKKPAYKAAATTWERRYKDDARRREAGVEKAIDRLAKEEVELDEISNMAHAKYRSAARADIKTQSKMLDADNKASDRIEKRVAGLARSTGLEKVKNMAKEEIEMEDVDFTIVEHNAFVVDLPETYRYSDYLSAAKVIVENEHDVVTVADYFFNLQDDSLIIEAFTRGDIEDKVKAHQNAGHQVTMPKYSTKEGKPYAEYTVTSKDSGQKTRYIHHGTTRKTERLG